MKGFVFIITTLLAGVLRSSAVEINCEEDVLVNCGSEEFDESLRFDSEEMLSNNCGGILADLECKTNYFARCDVKNHQVFLLLTNGLKGLFYELCNETSELRKGYQQHITCFRNSSNVFFDCILSSYPSLQNVSSNEGSTTATDNYIICLCRFQESFRTCTTRDILDKCGDGAARYLETLYTKVLNELVEAKC